MILAIDTATQYAGLALYSQDGIYCEEFWHSGRNHTIELMPRIVRMLNQAKLEVSGLSALAVSLGPGSFTGLRIGLAVAKGLALPHKLPVVGIPTLDIVAQPFKGIRQPVWAVAQAGRGRILVACYVQNKQHWQRAIDPYLTNFGDLAARITRPALCTGEIDAEATHFLRRETEQRAKIVSPAVRVRRAAYLAEIAAERLAAGEEDDPDALSPIYLSNP